MIKYLDLTEMNKPYIDDFFLDLKDIFKNSDFINGSFVEKFEEKFAYENNSKYAIGVSSGTDALAVILSALQLKPSDGVIYYPSNTFIGSILGGLQMGFKFKPYDVSLETMNSELENFNFGEDASAVIGVHLYGYGLKSIKKMSKICKDRGIPLIEDCSQAHFQTVKKTCVGNFGTVSFFSLYPGKNLGGIGDGGIICTNQKQLAEKILAIRNYGSTKKYFYDYKGFNHRLDTIQAAFLLRKIGGKDKEIIQRRKISEIYLKDFKDLENIKSLNISPQESVWHIFPLLVKDRDHFVKYMTAKDIQTNVHYPNCIHDIEVWKDQICKGESKNGTFISRHIVSIPCHSQLTDLEVQKVSAAVVNYDKIIYNK